MKLFEQITIQAVLAVIVIAGGMAIITFVKITEADKIGLFGIMGVVLSFYFGSAKKNAK